MQAIRGHAYIIGLIYSFEMFVCRTSIFISILGYVLLGQLITAEIVFSVTAIYNALRPVITILFSLSLSSLAEVNVSALRVQKFLSHEEIANNNIHKSSEIEKSVKNDEINGSHTPLKDKFTNGVQKKKYETAKLRLHNVCAKWIEESTENTLENINVNVNQNQLLAVIGPVGSGKSSFINVILGELSIKSGHMDLKGKISYASQEPWLFSGE